ncbi:helix-turn-helix transcriptional regulator [Rheinheimera maricola]
MGGKMQLLKLPEVLQIVRVGKTTWYTMIKQNEAPAPISLGARSVAWDSNDIENWINKRKAMSQKN